MNRRIRILPLLAVLGLAQAPNASAMLAMQLDGGRIGNGGGLVVCRENQTIKSVELLDFYEGKKLRSLELELGAFQGNWKQRAQAMIDRLGVQSPFRRTFYSTWLNHFEDESIFLKDVEFSKIPDSAHVAVPRGCEFEQGAIQMAPRFAHDKRYYINDELWQAMSDDQRAGLVLHEFFYREAIGYGHTDSISVRYLTALLASKSYAKIDRTAWISTLQNARFEMTDLAFRGFAVQLQADLREIWKPGPGEALALFNLTDRIPVLLGTCSGEGCSVYKEASVPPEVLGPVGGEILQIHPLVREFSFDGIALNSRDGGGWDRMHGSFELFFQYGHVAQVTYPSVDQFDADLGSKRLFTVMQSAQENRGRAFGYATTLRLQTDRSGHSHVAMLEGRHFEGKNLQIWAESCGNMSAQVEESGSVSTVRQGSEAPRLKNELGRTCTSADSMILARGNFEGGKIEVYVGDTGTDRVVFFDKSTGLYEMGGGISQLEFDASKVKYTCNGVSSKQGCMARSGEYHAGGGIHEIVIDGDPLITAPTFQTIVKSQVIKLHPNGVPQSLIASRYPMNVTYEDGSTGSIADGVRVAFDDKGLALK